MAAFTVVPPGDRLGDYRVTAGLIAASLAARYDPYPASAVLPLELVSTGDYEGLTPKVCVRSVSQRHDGAFVLMVDPPRELDASFADRMADILVEGYRDGLRHPDRVSGEAAAIRRSLASMRGIWGEGFWLGQVARTVYRGSERLCVEIGTLDGRLRPTSIRLFGSGLDDIKSSIAYRRREHRYCLRLRKLLDYRGCDFWIDEAASIVLEDAGLSVAEASELLEGGPTLVVEVDGADVSYSAAELRFWRGVLGADISARTWATFGDVLLPDIPIAVPHAVAAAAIGRPFGATADIKGRLGRLVVKDISLVTDGILCVNFTLPRTAVFLDR